MVFIFLGAVKAAKQAKLEYEKDKKRNAVITPVAGSNDMMRDRLDDPGASAPSNAGAQDWWGTNRTETAVSSSSAAQPQHGGVGAWSRDQLIDQIADAQAAREAERDAQSSSSLALSSGRPPYESSGSASTQHASPNVQQLSRGSADVASPSAQSDTRHVQRQSHTTDKAPLPDLPTSVADDEREPRRQSQRSANLEGSFLREQRMEKSSDGKPPRSRAGVKPLAEGSFEAAVKQGTARKTERLDVAKPAGPTPASSTTSADAVSALARNASKGRRRRVEQPTNAGSAVEGSFAATMPGAVAGAAQGSGDVRRTGSSAGDGRAAADEPNRDLVKVTSALASAGTKKRVGRRQPVGAVAAKATTGAATAAGASPAATKQVVPRAPTRSTPSESKNQATSPVSTQASAPASGSSSMYAEGTMKKRVSRR